MRPRSERIRILLIDDDEDDFMIVRDLIADISEQTDLRCTLDWARSHREGLAAMLVPDHDAYLVDFHLGRDDGLSIVRSAGARGVTAPMILLTGQDDPALDATAATVGAADYLVKGQLTAPLLARALRYALARADDIRERDALRLRLVTADRMASMGSLASGVAHAINNPLSCALANAAVARAKIEAMSIEDCAPALRTFLIELRSEVIDIEKSAERVRTIVTQLEVFGRGPTDPARPTDVKLVIEATLAVAVHEVRHCAVVKCELGAMPLVLANEGRLGQVFLNLVLNAAHATEAKTGRACEIDIRAWTDGEGRAVVTIEDNGPGISPEDLPRIFDPFFASGAGSAGRGLGLSVCHAIVRGMNGAITATSELDRGTCFTLAFPAAGVSRGSSSSPSVITEARRGRVLVVDDEEGVARSLGRLLSAGHDVYTRTSAAEALALLDRGEQFDVILCDLMMPEVTGMDLHAELLARSPDTARRMRFMTGGAVTQRARRFLEELPHRWIAKPFSREQLLAVVERALAG